MTIWPPATVTLFASSSDSSVTPGSINLGHSSAKLKLKTGQNLIAKVKTAFPKAPTAGTYFIVAQATGSGVVLPAADIVAASNTVTVVAPFLSLQGPGAGGPLSATRGKPLSF